MRLLESVITCKHDAKHDKLRKIHAFKQKHKVKQKHKHKTIPMYICQCLKLISKFNLNNQRLT